MRPFICCLLLAGLVRFASAEFVVRAPDRGRAALEAYVRRGIEILGPDGRGGWVLRLGSEDAAWIAERGTRLEQIPAYALKEDFDENMNGYHSVAEMQTRIAEWSVQYPGLLLAGSLGSSVEGRSLPLLEISDAPGVDEGEPELLIMGCLHARELMSSEIPFRFAEYLLTNYETDARVRDLVDSRRIFIAPLLNPDGRVYVEQHRLDPWPGWWRKNRRDNGDGTRGVDLNRNFSYEWGHDDVGSRPIPGAITYRGPAPFSEPETQAIRDFCASRSIHLGFSYHSFGNLLLYPWGYEYADSSEQEMFAALGEELVRDNGYRAGNPKSGAIYLTNGGSDDWAIGDGSDKKPFPLFTVEVGHVDDGGFAPPDGFIQPFFDRLLEMNLKLLEYADEPRRVLGPRPPLLAETVRWNSPELTIDWQDVETSAVNDPISWEIEELRELSVLSVDAVGFGEQHWEMDGFGIVAEGIANTPAYRSIGRDNDLQTLRSRLPLRVSTSQRIFRCRMRWDIEADFDYLYFQASPDGVEWTNLQGNVTTNEDPNGANRGHGITGSSGTPWQNAEFDLSPFLDRTVLLRFAYSTDGQKLGAGVWLDDLGPTPVAADRRIFVSGSPTLTLALERGGAFSYRVRGIDGAGDTGRWSDFLEVRADPVLDFIQLPVARSALRSIAPNPMNPSTTIRYEIAATRSAPVELDLYDVRGRRVRSLVDASRLGGRYGLAFDGRDVDGRPLANGVYHLVLRVDGRIADRRKLTVLK